MKKNINEIEKQLYSLLKEHVEIINDIDNIFEYNILHGEILDSFQFLNFILEIEQIFKVKFSNDDFQQSEFQTLSGIAKLIRDK